MSWRVWNKSVLAAGLSAERALILLFIGFFLFVFFCQIAHFKFPFFLIFK